MKKLLAFIAVAAFLTACNDSKKTEPSADSSSNVTVPMSDSSSKMMDTTSNMMDTSSKMMDTTSKMK